MFKKHLSKYPPHTLLPSSYVVQFGEKCCKSVSSWLQSIPFICRIYLGSATWIKWTDSTHKTHRYKGHSANISALGDLLSVILYCDSPSSLHSSLCAHWNHFLYPFRLCTTMSCYETLINQGTDLIPFSLIPSKTLLNQLERNKESMIPPRIGE